jgi:RNA polymerase sigma-70 factor (ECF subfamily)
MQPAGKPNTLTVGCIIRRSLASMAGPISSDTTLALVQRAEAGDCEAADALFARYAPVLHRWAHGRLPRWARDIADTEDLVQDALFQTFRNLSRFEYRGQGALYAYLRHSVLNRIKEELRKRAHRPGQTALDSAIEHPGRSPLETAIGCETLGRYDAALERLSTAEREAIIARVELGLSHREIAEALGKGSADAARMAVARALVRLVREMKAG